jgi:hypothetical protein
MLLASVQEIRDRLGFDDMTDIMFAAQMALDAATPQIEAMLNTSFTQGSYVETFYVEKPPYIVKQAFRTKFRLNNGFVALTSVKSSYELAAFSAAPPSTTVKDVTSTVMVDVDRGIVDDINNRYEWQYVQIAYSAGFPPDPNDSDSYDLTQIPDWLKQAAKLRAMIGMADDASLSEAGIKLDTKTLWAQFNALVSRKMRYAPTAKMPL